MKEKNEEKWKDLKFIEPESQQFHWEQFENIMLILIITKKCTKIDLYAYFFLIIFETTLLFDSLIYISILSVCTYCNFWIFEIFSINFSFLTKDKFNYFIDFCFLT